MLNKGLHLPGAGRLLRINQSGQLLTNQLHQYFMSSVFMGILGTMLGNNFSLEEVCGLFAFIAVTTAWVIA